MKYDIAEKKRILLISVFPPVVGGISTSSDRLRHKLENDPRYSVFSYDVGYKGRRSFVNDVLAILKFLYAPLFILFHRRFDVIHCHLPHVARKLYFTLCKPLFFPRTKLIFTIHGDIGNLLKQRFASLSLSGADRIICVQQGDSRSFPEKFAERAVDIPAFIAPEKNSFGQPVPEYIVSFVKNVDPAPLIVMNGALIVNDKYDDLYGFGDTMRLFDELEKRGNAAYILMIQNGFPKNTLEEKLSEEISGWASGRSRILFVKDTVFDLWPVFKYSDIYIRPTKTDGDALSVREALYFGNTVVASDAACRPEGVSLYKSGDHVDLLEKMLCALSVCRAERGIKKYAGNDFYDEITKQYEL